jgi:hypothetical protein
VAAALTKLKLTALQVLQTIDEETNGWIAEFRTTLNLIDEAARQGRSTDAVRSQHESSEPRPSYR